jgi:hypothetical protein
MTDEQFRRDTNTRLIDLRFGLMVVCLIVGAILGIELARKDCKCQSPAPPPSTAPAVPPPSPMRP